MRTHIVHKLYRPFKSNWVIHCDGEEEPRWPTACENTHVARRSWGRRAEPTWPTAAGSEAAFSVCEKPWLPQQTHTHTDTHTHSLTPPGETHTRLQASNRHHTLVQRHRFTHTLRTTLELDLRPAACFITHTHTHTHTLCSVGSLMTLKSSQLLRRWFIGGKRHMKHL